VEDLGGPLFVRDPDLLGWSHSASIRAWLGFTARVFPSAALPSTEIHPCAGAAFHSWRAGASKADLVLGTGTERTEAIRVFGVDHCLCQRHVAESVFTQRPHALVMETSIDASAEASLVRCTIPPSIGSVAIHNSPLFLHMKNGKQLVLLSHSADHRRCPRLRCRIPRLRNELPSSWAIVIALPCVVASLSPVSFFLRRSTANPKRLASGNVR
jgi:hypothetical protein